jgi:hypothetical protein
MSIGHHGESFEAKLKKDEEETNGTYPTGRAVWCSQRIGVN